jgi:catechol 2,3-dioxygenase-like lactoylglutathione lyase family enzyme
MTGKPPKPIKVEGMAPHIAVFDMPTSVAFYRDVLGFSVVKQSGPGDDFDWGLLRLDDAELMLNTAYDRDERPSAPDPGRFAAHEDTTFYFACRDVDAAYTHVRAKGIDLGPPKVSWYGMKQLYMKDPDGYLVCFQWPAA